MFRLVLEGQCNKCGLCCAPIIDGDRWACENLAQIATLGQPEATYCRVYASRYDGMPINLVHPDGRLEPARCTKGTEEESRAIMNSGFARGCSLTAKLTVEDTYGSISPTSPVPECEPQT